MEGVILGVALTSRETEWGARWHRDRYSVDQYMGLDFRGRWLAKYQNGMRSEECCI